MTKLERIICSILVCIGSILIIVGYSFFDGVNILTAIGLGLISVTICLLNQDIKEEEQK